jgi:hypothetical protein
MVRATKRSETGAVTGPSGAPPVADFQLVFRGWARLEWPAPRPEPDVEMVAPEGNATVHDL